MIKQTHIVLFVQLTTLLFLPAVVSAESTIATGSSLNAFSLMNILNMMMGLVVVVALILGLAWVLKKYGRLPNHNLVDMKVLGGLSLGTREKAILIEVENTRLLVGVTPGHIQTLHVLDGKSPENNASFAAALQQVEKTHEDA